MVLIVRQCAPPLGPIENTVVYNMCVCVERGGQHHVTTAPTHFGRVFAFYKV